MDVSLAVLTVDEETAQRSPNVSPVVLTHDGIRSRKGERVGNVDVDSCPSSFQANSIKQELCLEYVDNFRKQFEKLFPDRKRLFLFPPNECGVRKFVCTTLRPTQLPNRELYTLDSCAQFVSQFMLYEPLDDLMEPPAFLPSPSQVLQWRVGDSFDYAMVLASFLLGVGYDAFVVVGSAPKWVVLRDQTHCKCPDSFDEVSVGSSASEETQEENVSSNPYFIPTKHIPQSQYLSQKQQQSAPEAKEDEDCVQQSDSEDDEVESSPTVSAEKAAGLCHAWILVRAGLRGVENHIYIEPSTGRMYGMAEAPYLGIEAMFNSVNYWVNMQPSTVPFADLSFDLRNTSLWEFILVKADPMDAVEEEQDRPGGDEEKDAEDEDGEHKGEALDVEGGDDILGLPPSWVPKLMMGREELQSRFHPHGYRSTLYLRATLEEFTAAAHPDGLTSKLVVYRDRARTIPLKIVEKFVQRRDKLSQRVRYPLKSVLLTRFEAGRSHGLKEIYLEQGKRRVFRFYPASRLDGLMEWDEIIGSKIYQSFSPRQGQLLERVMLLDPSGSSTASKEEKDGSVYPQQTLPIPQLQEVPILNMTEKYAPPSEAECVEKAIAKKRFDVQGGKIQLRFHFAPSRITMVCRVHYKDPKKQSEVVSGDFLLSEMMNAEEIAEERQRALRDEKKCYDAIRAGVREMNEILQTREREEGNIIVEKTIFETARERARLAAEAALNATEAVVKDEREVDYLTPFLQFVIKPSDIQKDEARKAFDECLKALKERLLERANIIQRRLDEENSKLAKKQAEFQRNRDHTEGADEHFEKFCSEAMFRIQILEQRLQRHEETALKKYAELDALLHNDPRLSVLFKPK